MKKENYTRMETVQEGVKVVLEFPEPENEQEQKELWYIETGVRQEVDRVLSHALKGQIRQNGIHRAERVSC